MNETNATDRPDDGHLSNELLSGLLDDELTSEAAAGISSHLSGCQECTGRRRRLEGLNDLVSSESARGGDPPPVDPFQRDLSVSKALGAFGETTSRARRRKIRPLQVAAVIAAIAAVVVGGNYLVTAPSTNGATPAMQHVGPSTRAVPGANQSSTVGRTSASRMSLRVDNGRVSCSSRSNEAGHATRLRKAGGSRQLCLSVGATVSEFGTADVSTYYFLPTAGSGSGLRVRLDLRRAVFTFGPTALVVYGLVVGDVGGRTHGRQLTVTGVTPAGRVLLHDFLGRPRKP